MSPTSRTSAEIIAEALEHFDIAIRHSERWTPIRAHASLAASGRKCGGCATASPMTTTS